MRKLCAVAAGVLWLTTSYAAIVQRQVASVAPAVGTSRSASLASDALAGSLIVCEVFSAASTAPTSLTIGSETVVSANTWAGQPAGNYQGAWYVKNATGGPETCTATFSTSRNLSVFIAEYTGADTSSPLDQATAIATGNGTGPATSSLTPSQSGELAISFCTICNSIVWNNGFVTTPNGSENSLKLGDQILSGTSPITASATTSSGSWDISLVLFKPAAGGASCTHSGQLANGTIAVPTAGSTSVLVPSEGTFDTVDCSTKGYKQPTSGAIGVN